MQVFIYEFVTGGGWWSVDDAAPPAGSLCQEGEAMLHALAADFTALPGVDVLCLRDERLPVKRDLPIALTGVGDVARASSEFSRHAAQADWTAIAPEIAGHLLQFVGAAQAAGGRLVSPDSTFVAIAADKHATAERLRSAGIAAPRGDKWQPGQPFPAGLAFPCVAKPLDGAGSIGVQKISSSHGLEALAEQPGTWRLESFCPGLPASVALLSGPDGVVVLLPRRQILSQDGRFRYLGGETPLPFSCWDRAQRLARSVAAALPATTGYFGIDLVLGDAPDGSLDWVIEVNPRLTTSYIGLRRRARGNLAAAMLSVAQGQPVELSFDSEPIQFSAAGEQLG